MARRDGRRLARVLCAGLCPLLLPEGRLLLMSPDLLSDDGLGQDLTDADRYILRRAGQAAGSRFVAMGRGPPMVDENYQLLCEDGDLVQARGRTRWVLVTFFKTRGREASRRPRRRGPAPGRPAPGRSAVPPSTPVRPAPPPSTPETAVAQPRFIFFDSTDLKLWFSARDEQRTSGSAEAEGGRGRLPELIHRLLPDSADSLQFVKTLLLARPARAPPCAQPRPGGGGGRAGWEPAEAALATRPAARPSPAIPSIFSFKTPAQNPQEIPFMYICMVGSFLMIFIPQECTSIKASCSSHENLNLDSPLGIAALAVNAITCASIVVGEVFFFRREAWLIEWLDMDLDYPSTNLKSVIKAYPRIGAGLRGHNARCRVIAVLGALMMLLNFSVTAAFVVRKTEQGNANGGGGRVCCPGVVPGNTKTISTMLTSAGVVFIKLMQYRGIAARSLNETLGMSAVHKLPLIYNMIDADHVVDERVAVRSRTKEMHTFLSIVDRSDRAPGGGGGGEGGAESSGGWAPGSAGRSGRAPRAAGEGAESPRVGSVASPRIALA